MKTEIEMKDAVYFWFSAILILIKSAEGHSIYQQSIPNGEMVPHPCKPNFLWRGVGHDNINGGGTRNPFGRDFEENDKVWNETLCHMDSDGDGKSNGLELGDPDCLWTPKQKPAKTTGLSHPGICEPIGSDKCKGKASESSVDCEHTEFKCPSVEDPNNKAIKTLTARLINSLVPTKETTYICRPFEFPAEEQHIIAFKPYVVNQNVVHHMVVFGCRGDFPENRNMKYCGMVPNRLCVDVIAVWSLGMSGHCMHKDCGILVGGTNGFKWAALQVHWNNPGKMSGQIDSSGMILYLSSQLRPFNAGILSIGQTKIAIPPGQEEYTEQGTCDASCTKVIMTDKITVVSIYNHMHYLGKAQTTDLVTRSGAEARVMHLAHDEKYSYDDPILHEFQDGVVVHPGDELKTTCVYKSTSRHQVTKFGDDTDDEMCFSFLTYFPAENSETACISDGDATQCATKDAETCDLSRLDQSSPEIMIMLTTIEKHCTPGLCRNECLTYVREMQKDPCYEEINGNLRRLLVKVNDFDYYINIVFAAFDSCTKELMMEQIATKGCRDVMDGWFDMSHAPVRNWQYFYLPVALLASWRCFRSHF